jgi:hypothetical protein
MSCNPPTFRNLDPSLSSKVKVADFQQGLEAVSMEKIKDARTNTYNGPFQTGESFVGKLEDVDRFLIEIVISVFEAMEEKDTH